MSRLFSAAVFLGLCATLALSQEKAEPKKKAPLKKQTPLEKTYQTQREILTKLRAERNELEKTDEVAKLRAAWKKASEALNEQVAKATAKERQAEKAAYEALQQAVTKRIESSKEIEDAKEKRQELTKQKRDLDFQIATVNLQLYHSNSPAQQALDADPDLAKLQQAYGKSKGEARAAARNKYFEARKAKLKSLKSAQPLFAKIEKLKSDIESIDKQQYELWGTVNQLERDIRYGKKDDKQLTALREAVTEARNATKKASFNDATKEARTVASKANFAYGKKVQELSRADKDIQQLQKQLETVNKQIAELRPKKPVAKKPETKKKPKNKN